MEDNKLVFDRENAITTEENTRISNTAFAFDNEAMEMDDRTPRIVVEQVDEDDDEVIDDNIEVHVQGDEIQTEDRNRKESTSSQLTDGSHRSSMSRRLSTSLHIDIDVDDDPEFEVRRVLQTHTGLWQNR